MIVLLVLAVAALPAGLSVDVAGGADPCALESRVPQALARWMPAPSSQRVHLSITPRGGDLYLTLTSSTGDALLSRSVPNQPQACAATADGISLVVETYLQDVGWIAEDTELPPMTTVSEPSDDAATGLSTAAANRRTRIDLAAEARAIAAQQFAMGGAVAARIGFAWFEAVARLAATAPANVLSGDSTFRVWTLHVLAGPGGCASTDWARVCGDLVAGAERVSGGTSGVFQLQTVAAWSPLVAARARLDMPLAQSGFGLTAALGGVWRPDPRRFVIEDGGAYQLPAGAVTASIGAWVRIY